MNPAVFLALSLLLCASAPLGAFGAEAARVDSEPLWPESRSKADVVAWAGAGFATSGPVARLQLREMAYERIESLKHANAQEDTGPLRVGIERDLGSEVQSRPDLRWELVTGGRVARLDVESPGAAALRVAVSAVGLPDDAVLRYAGVQSPQEVMEAGMVQLRDHTDSLGRFWTATTSGDRQHLEWFVASEGVSLAPPAVVGVAHLFVDPAGPDPQRKALGDAAACNRDVACYTAELGEPFVAAKNSVAHYVFQGCRGHVVCMCSGSLLNDMDADTQRKWFYTAYHCIDSQAKANTMDTFWSYEASTCGVVGAGQNIRVGGGAQVTVLSSEADAALLELRGDLPPGVHFAGWDAAPIATGSPVTAIHHPRGDSKKVSFGSYTGMLSGMYVGGGPGLESFYVSPVTQVSWRQGTPEGASSGSGLFTVGPDSYYLRGSLVGGDVSCSGGTASYGQFATAYETFQSHLGQVAPGPSRDYTGAWHNENESGRGLTFYRFPNEHLFGLWFAYDDEGRPNWFELDGDWTGPDIRSGRVLRWTGDPWGPTYDPAVRFHETAGSFTLTFTSATQARFAYDVDGVRRTIGIVKITP